MELNTIYNEDCLETMKRMPDDSVDCVITSPPYWGLRDYGHSGQLGQERKLEDFVIALTNTFTEIYRVLKNDGVVWVNISDSFVGSWGNYAPGGIKGKQREQTNTGKRWERKAYGDTTYRPPTSYKQSVPNKSMAQIPARFSIAMAERGWILRNEVIWHKPNATPTSAKDRLTVDYEKILMFSKSKHYQFNHLDKRMRSVWSIPTHNYKDAHFATYPVSLIVPIVQMSTTENQIIYDPFMGSGTTAVACKNLNRNYIGSEISKEYCDIAEQRVEAVMRGLYEA